MKILDILREIETNAIIPPWIDENSLRFRETKSAFKEGFNGKTEYKVPKWIEIEGSNPHEEWTESQIERIKAGKAMKLGSKTLKMEEKYGKTLLITNLKERE